MEIPKEKIERRAYKLFLARGGQHGNAMEDWFAAEKEITANMTTKKGKPKGKKNK